MQSIVIGLGSMGRRRVRLLKDFEQIDGIAGVDLSEQRRHQASQELGISTYASLDEALSVMNATLALVCTSPVSHASIIQKCLASGLHTFTEINLVPDGYEENLELARQCGLVLFLSSTFLYRKETLRIASEVSGARGTYSYHVGQYLPDWHPWESWHDYFVATPRTSGIRELLAIELPWIQHAFGPVNHFTAMARHISKLDVPYDDTVMLMLEHNNGSVGMLTIDVVCRKAVRKFEFSNETLYLTWEGTPHTLQKLDLSSGTMEKVSLYEDDEVEHREGYASFVVENAYHDELAAFINAVEKCQEPLYGITQDAVTLGLIDKIEGSL